MADETAASTIPEQPQPTPGADAAAPQAEAKRVVRAKGQRHIPTGVAHVDATFNNTKVSIADMHGNIVAWCSAGRLSFRGSRKSTAYVAQQVGAEAARRAMAVGMKEVEVRLKGPGAGRESAVRGIASAGLDISILKDVTPLPHNGCRPPKRRRV
jgi:small subunit ribosomal protein S11